MGQAPLLPHVLNLGYIEEMQAAYRRDHRSVAPQWQEYFRAQPDPPPGIGLRQDRLNQLIEAYRVRGHLSARVDPLGAPPPVPAELEPTSYGFSTADLDELFSCQALHQPRPLILRQILELLRDTYCRSIGVQYMHIDDPAVRRWLQERMEGSQNRFRLSRETQVRILSRLTDAAIFEEFVRKKFLGAKTFSLEGCESLIALLDLAIEKAGEQGVKEIVLAMAHRGRLNVLANLMGKDPRLIFREFEDTFPEPYEYRGDVKYHLGYSSDWTTAGARRVHLSLCFNPSHLEFVNPVALGRVRAKQDRIRDAQRESAMALLIHGDAAFAGQGIAQETLNLSQLAAYQTGGTLHVIVNNQIGFTTPPSEGRSSHYATDVARLLQVPLFHVNGEDPEAVAQCLRVAMDFRQQFKRDVFIDMYGYRKLGHNETDEPGFTQPVLCRAIAERKPVREGYLEHLLALKELSREDADQIAAQRRACLEKELSEARANSHPAPEKSLRGIWARSRFHGGPEDTADEVDTGVGQERLSATLRQLVILPEGFTPHPKLARLRQGWERMAAEEEPVDWAAAEALAFGTLALEGVRVRLSGQDSCRGTFSQRHAVLHDYHGHGTFIPLQHLDPGQATVEIFNSPLSEAGVLGFEYGFSLDSPDALVLWEAQFGDFANAAQVILDQFVTSAEEKWRRLSGLVLLLPHGFEGMGPEHSSARLERFLQLCAQDNLQVAQPTTPAQYFHLLRRQALRAWRKPLVILTPKSLLRLAQARSPLQELADGQFQRVLPDSAQFRDARRLLLCGGKIFYELLERREALGRTDTAIVRLEQYYPLPMRLLEEVLTGYASARAAVWVQEEPVNMGAWPFLGLRLGRRLFDRWPFSVVGRAESSSPAAGSANTHRLEQERILEAALGAAPLSAAKDLEDDYAHRNPSA
jgi:2-oxoglutarate dehydrogenase E1 component